MSDALSIALRLGRLADQLNLCNGRTVRPFEEIYCIVKLLRLPPGSLQGALLVQCKRARQHTSAVRLPAALRRRAARAAWHRERAAGALLMK